MKKILLLKALLLFTIFSANAQFQESFINTLPGSPSSDHYSIETAPDTAPYSYACAGTFISTGGQTSMHIFTLDDFGLIVWENYVNLGVTDARVLDVTIGKESHVAVTGFVDPTGSGTELYAALYNGTNGTLINDYQFAGANNATGCNIIYSTINDQYVIGGFEATGVTPPLVGNGLLITLTGGFTQDWVSTYNASSDFQMTTINEIVEVRERYFITGNHSNAINPGTTGQSQVLAALVDNFSGAIIDNESFIATSITGQEEAMGVSAHFNSDENYLVLLYNVSNSPTIDENRPYIAKFRLIGLDLVFDSGHRIDDVFPTNPSAFGDVPSFTGFKILPNSHDNTYLIFGMLEEYGQFNDRVLSVYQEIDLMGNIIDRAKYWTRSEIPTGYPVQGGLYSFFNELTLNTDVYTPESTTLNKDLNNYVSISPTQDGSFSFDVMSSALSTVNADSPCIEEFDMEMVGHGISTNILLDATPGTGTFSAPLYVPVDPNTDHMTDNCPVFSSPALGNTAVDLQIQMENELTLLANPANDVLRFSITENGNYDLIIMNIEGQILVKDKLNNTGSQNQININDLATGVYILTAINTKGESLQKHFVKQ
ncbi:MAG: T9SS type A sorting domain-containing protein [Crocinitomix sp.]|nr:T9SS type A sorting domain-containing protein [Crocinitomix sp.]